MDLVEEPGTESSKSSKIPRKRGPKSKKTSNDIPMTSFPVSNISEAKNNDNKLELKELKEEKSDKEQRAEESPKIEADIELDKKKEAKVRVFF